MNGEEFLPAPLRACYARQKRGALSVFNIGHICLNPGQSDMIFQDQMIPTQGDLVKRGVLVVLVRQVCVT